MKSRTKTKWPETAAMVKWLISAAAAHSALKSEKTYNSWIQSLKCTGFLKFSNGAALNVLNEIF